MLPTLAIIGRPNVGKSTLFNRIVGQRKALTYDAPGVTRDRNFEVADWHQQRFLCVDTGGFPLDEETLDEKVFMQIELAIEESDVILCVFDGKVGMIPEEQAIVSRLRQTNKTVFYAVNKIDVLGHEDRLNDFYKLGVDQLFPVSGEHGYGLDDLLEGIVQSFPEQPEEAPLDDETVKIALVGRPNVGKSSLTNALLGESRVVVDATPGTTRDSIDTSFEFEGKPCLLIDTAGIRRRSQKGGFLEKITILQSTRAIERADICIQLLSAEEGIRTQDAHIAGMIMSQNKGHILAWNKIDLITTHKEEKRAELREQIARDMPFLADIPKHYISAQFGKGVDRLLPEVFSLHDELGSKIKTAQLNKVFEYLVDHHNMPLYKGREVKLYYATQVGTHPPTFIVFTNIPQGIPASYQRYLIHGLQDRLDLKRVPVKVVFRKRK